ncbi:MAG: hypothetical protein U0441_39060 [Polyangiaceae bacterium]
MKHPLRTLALSLALFTPALSGCGGIFDIAYLASHRTTEESVTEHKPTGQTHRALEFEGSAGTAGVLQLTCEDRDRMIERASSVHKTYRYIGGYTSSPYIATAVLSGVTAGAVAGIIALACENDAKSTPEQKTSCLQNMLFATPFAVDSVYSSIRAATAKKPKLIEKEVSSPVLTLSEKPVRAAPVACDASQVFLKDPSGPMELSATQILSGEQEDKTPLSLEGAVRVPVSPEGQIRLGELPELVRYWGDNPSFIFWVVDPDGRAHRLSINRCQALGPVSNLLTPPAQMRLSALCAPPPPPR